MPSKHLLFIAATCIFASCGNQQSANTYEATATAPTHEMVTSKVTSDTTAKMIKTADIACEVPDVLNLTMTLERMTREMGGYVQTSTINNLQASTDASVEVGDSVRIIRQNNISADLVLQIPATMLDSVMNYIPRASISVSNRHLTQQDASLDFLANEWRLQNAAGVSKQHMASTATPLFANDEQIIASKVQNLSILKKVSFSPLSVHLSQPPVVSTVTLLNVQRASTPPFTASVVAGLRSGTQAVQSLIVALAYIWPLLFVVATAITIVYFIRRKALPRAS